MKNYLNRPLIAVAFLALLAASCAGSNDSSSNGSSRNPAQQDQSSTELQANPANCPVKALESASEPIELTVWHPYNALTKESLEKAATQYNAAQSKVRVSVEAQGTYEELLKKYEESLADPASLPDVVFAEDTTLQFMIDSQSIIPADDCIAADPSAGQFYKELLPAVRNAFSSQGQLWPGAFGVSMPIMYVNNAHLTAAGLSTTELPATLAQVRSAAEKIKAANIPGVEFPVVMELYGWFPENWLTGVQQEIVDQGNGHDGPAGSSEMKNQYTTEVLEWLAAMQQDGLLKAYPYAAGIDQFLAIGNQSSSILIDGSRAITTVNAIVQNSYTGEAVAGAGSVDSAALAGLDLGVGLVPGLKAAGQGAVWGSAAYLVAGTEDAQIAAGWDFVKFFNSTKVQVDWTLQGSYLPVSTAVQEDPDIVNYFANDPAGKWLAVANKQLLGLDPDFPGPVIGPYNQFRSGIHTMLERVVLSGDNPETALSEFNKKFKADLDAYAKEVAG